MNIGLITYHRYCNERQGCESRPTRYFRHHEHEPFHTSICVRAQLCSCPNSGGYGQ
jgi:hypothetical protein